MNKGNQKHLTFDQRIEIEKGLAENKSFAEIARSIGKDPSTISKEVRLHAQDLIQDTLIHPVYIVRTAKSYCSVMNSAGKCARYVHVHTFGV